MKSRDKWNPLSCWHLVAARSDFSICVSFYISIGKPVFGYLWWSVSAFLLSASSSAWDRRWKHSHRHCGGPQRLGWVRVPSFGQKRRRSGRTEPSVGQDQDGGRRSGIAHFIHPDLSAAQRIISFRSESRLPCKVQTSNQFNFVLLNCTH